MAERDLILLDAGLQFRAGDVIATSEGDGSCPVAPRLGRITRVERDALTYRWLRWYERAWLWAKAQWGRSRG